MEIGEILIVVFLVYYSITLYSLFKPNNRAVVKKTNIKMDSLRSIPVKTVKEQKEFLDVRYPKGKFKFKKEMVPSVLINMGCFIVLFQFFKLQLFNLGWNIRIWHGILFVMVMPILINLLLRKFNLQKNDISVFFR